MSKAPNEVPTATAAVGLHAACNYMRRVALDTQAGLPPQAGLLITDRWLLAGRTSNPQALPS
jgi:hypothetical protein